MKNFKTIYFHSPRNIALKKIGWKSRCSKIQYIVNAIKSASVLNTKNGRDSILYNGTKDRKVAHHCVVRPISGI